MIGVQGARAAVLKFVVSAKDLPTRDRECIGATVQDPYIKFLHRDKTQKDNDFKLIGTTKHRVNEPNPEYYDTVFSFDWMQGMGQKWRFEVLDFDVLNKDDSIGHVLVDVDEYVLNGEEIQIKLDGTSQGSLHIKKVEQLKFRLAAKMLPKKDAFEGLSDPYVKCFWSAGKDTPLHLFHTTKTVKNVEDCQWDEEIVFPTFQSKANQFWTFKLFDKDPLPKDDALGEAVVSVNDFVHSKDIFMVKIDGTSDAKLFITPIAN
jgi:Ca2+-dependent lipid-binding protein